MRPRIARADERTAAPIDPGTITAEWATWMLREQELLTQQQNVTSVSVTEFDAGKTGRCGRVVLTFDAEQVAAPASVVVKMSRTDFKGRFLNLVLFLSREAFFFKELGGARASPRSHRPPHAHCSKSPLIPAVCVATAAAESPMSIPKCLYTSVSWFSNAFIIVMDDVAPSHELSDHDEVVAAFSKPPFDNSTTVPIEQVEMLTSMVSKMHAQYLGDTSLYKKRWILGAETMRTNGGVSSEYDVTWMFVLSTWKKTRQNVVEGKWLGTPWSDKMLKVLDDTMEYVRQLDLGVEAKKGLWPKTLTHGDFHGNNILIKEVAGGGKVKSPLEAVVLDFQIMQMNEPVADLGKLFLIGLSPEDRR